MTFKTVDFSAVLNFLWVPLDFLGKNSYYLSVGCAVSIPSVLVSGRQGTCIGVKIYFQLRRRNSKLTLSQVKHSVQWLYGQTVDVAQ